MKISSIAVVIKSPSNRRVISKRWSLVGESGAGGKPVADPASLQRYSTAMLNVISEGLDMNATSAQNAAQRSAGATFDVQSAADDTGLPMLVVRAPFNPCGSVCPAPSRKGMSDRQHALQGSMARPISRCLTAAGRSWAHVTAAGLRDYKLQVGDPITAVACSLSTRKATP